MTTVDIRFAHFPDDLPRVTGIFREYIASVSVDLSFQGYEGEFAALPGPYAPPGGRLLLAWKGEAVVGCVALRPVDARTCEMKRLYVRPAGRGAQVGRRLIERLLREAKEAGYTRICLDVLPEFKAAQHLYAAFGFTQAPPVVFNPVPGTRFLALDLSAPVLPEDVLRFWLVETSPRQWWTADPAFDTVIAERFGALHEAASRGELADWRNTPRGRLAEVIVLDQFSRNLFRGHPRAWACDGMALALAQEAVAGGHDQALPPAPERAFLYMPFMHSESRLIHEQAERLFASLGEPGRGNLEAERWHKAIVDRYGRYPHRNEVLGRTSTPEELAFLQQPGSRF